MKIVIPVKIIDKYKTGFFVWEKCFVTVEIIGHNTFFRQRIHTFPFNKEAYNSCPDVGAETTLTLYRHSNKSFYPQPE